MASVTAEQIKDAFGKVGSGEDSLQGTFKNLGLDLDEIATSFLLKSLNPNGDASITREEFKTQWYALKLNGNCPDAGGDAKFDERAINNAAFCFNTDGDFNNYSPSEVTKTIEEMKQDPKEVARNLVKMTLAGEGELTADAMCQNWSKVFS